MKVFNENKPIKYVKGNLQIVECKTDNKEFYNINIANKTMTELAETVFCMLRNIYDKSKLLEVRVLSNLNKMKIGTYEIKEDDKINIYGYIEDWSIVNVTKNRNKYDFNIKELYAHDFIKSIERLYNEYAIDLDTDVDNLKLIIERIEVL